MAAQFSVATNEGPRVLLGDVPQKPKPETLALGTTFVDEATGLASYVVRAAGPVPAAGTHIWKP